MKFHTAEQVAEFLREQGHHPELRQSMGMGYYFLNTQNVVMAWSDRSLSTDECAEPWADKLVHCEPANYQGWKTRVSYSALDYPLYDWELLEALEGLG